MDKELKELKIIACRCCPYGPDTTKACNTRYCEIKKVMDAYKNVKKDLAGRQKKFEKLTIDFYGMKASRDYYKENYENVKKDLAGRQKKNKQKKIESLSFDTTGLCEGQVD
jgi:hypothetical protein